MSTLLSECIQEISKRDLMPNDDTDKTNGIDCDDETGALADLVMEKIVQQEEKIDDLDKKCNQTKTFVIARFESQNVVGVVLSMKLYLKQHAERQHALKQMDELNDLLLEVESSSMLSPASRRQASMDCDDCGTKMNDILTQETPSYGDRLESNAFLLEQAAKLVQGRCVDAPTVVKKEKTTAICTSQQTQHKKASLETELSSFQPKTVEKDSERSSVIKMASWVLVPCSSRCFLYAIALFLSLLLQT